MSELETVLRLSRGDRTALGDLFHAYAHPAVRLAYSITGSQSAAEDAVQEAFVKVLQNISTLRDPGAFRSWFYRIVVNAAKRMARKAYRTLPLDLDDYDKPDHAAITPEEAVLADEEIKLLWAAISHLDEAHRVPIVLRYFIKLSEQEIAAALEIPPGTVKSRLHTARKLLHDQLARATEAMPARRLAGAAGSESEG